MNQLLLTQTKKKKCHQYTNITILSCLFEFHSGNSFILPPLITFHFDRFFWMDGLVGGWMDAWMDGLRCWWFDR